MLKKILIIKRLQPYYVWRNDCFIIARRVFEYLKLEVPEEKYKDVFIDLLATGIEFESNNDFLKEIFEDVYFLKDSNFKISIFNMIISDEYLEFVSSVINKITKDYFQKEKSNFIDKLNFFNNKYSKEGVVIYPNKTLKGITKRTFNFTCEKFESSKDSDFDCLDEYLTKNKNLSIYSIFN